MKEREGVRESTHRQMPNERHNLLLLLLAYALMKEIESTFSNTPTLHFDNMRSDAVCLQLQKMYKQ